MQPLFYSIQTWHVTHCVCVSSSPSSLSGFCSACFLVCWLSCICVCCCLAVCIAARKSNATAEGRWVRKTWQTNCWDGREGEEEEADAAEEVDAAEEAAEGIVVPSFLSTYSFFSSISIRCFWLLMLRLVAARARARERERERENRLRPYVWLVQELFVVQRTDKQTTEMDALHSLLLREKRRAKNSKQNNKEAAGKTLAGNTTHTQSNENMNTWIHGEYSYLNWG